MTEKLFGTDGYRGLANTSSETGINPTTFESLAFVYTRLVAEEQGRQPLVIVGGDTRESGPALIKAAALGAVAAGAEVWDVGVMPTPVIAWLAQRYSANGLVITASHNPRLYNGFKPFGVGGVKPDRETTLTEVERRYFAALGQKRGPTISGGRRVERPNLQNEYLDHVVASLGGRGVLGGKSVVVDGANGAAYELAPRLYRALGAQVIEFACTGKGALINQGVGAAHLEGVTERIQGDQALAKSKGFLGALTKDGDGDRTIGVDRFGRQVNGNHWLQQLADGQKGVVGTFYTNTAAREAVAAMGVEFHECDNGDSYVTAMLQALTKEHGSGYTRGGEFTGHLIDLNHLSSGDGLYMGAWMAVRMAQAREGEGITLADIHDGLKLWPEKMVGVPIEGANGRVMAAVAAEQAAIHAEYRGDVRTIVRESGTEPLVRVWAEARNDKLRDSAMARLTAVLQPA